jgi:hypothetical protein
LILVLSLNIIQTSSHKTKHSKNWQRLRLKNVHFKYIRSTKLHFAFFLGGALAAAGGATALALAPGPGRFFLPSK